MALCVDRPLQDLAITACVTVVRLRPEEFAAAALLRFAVRRARCKMERRSLSSKTCRRVLVIAPSSSPNLVARSAEPRPPPTRGKARRIAAAARASRPRNRSPRALPRPEREGSPAARARRDARARRLRTRAAARRESASPAPAVDRGAREAGDLGDLAHLEPRPRLGDQEPRAACTICVRIAS